MSKLIDSRKTKSIKLPSFPEDTVVLYDDILTGDAIELGKVEDEYENGIRLLMKIIKEWSFVGEDDKPLPVNKDSLSLIPVKDFSLLMDEVNKLMGFLDKKELKN